MTDSDRLTLALTILQEYAKGRDSLDTVAKRHGISGPTLRDWCVDNAEVAAAYTRARTVSAGAMEDEALDVARQSSNETYQQDRLRIDTLKWAAAKRHPKEYGDKVSTEHTVTIGTLHLEALQAPKPSVSATARLAQPVDTPADSSTE